MWIQTRKGESIRQARENRSRKITLVFAVLWQCSCRTTEMLWVQNWSWPLDVGVALASVGGVLQTPVAPHRCFRHFHVAGPTGLCTLQKQVCVLAPGPGCPDSLGSPQALLTQRYYCCIGLFYVSNPACPLCVHYSGIYFVAGFPASLQSLSLVNGGSQSTSQSPLLPLAGAQRQWHKC